MPSRASSNIENLTTFPVPDEYFLHFDVVNGSYIFCSEFDKNPNILPVLGGCGFINDADFILLFSNKLYGQREEVWYPVFMFPLTLTEVLAQSQIALFRTPLYTLNNHLLGKGLERYLVPLLRYRLRFTMTRLQDRLKEEGRKDDAMAVTKLLEFFREWLNKQGAIFYSQLCPTYYKGKYALCHVVRAYARVSEYEERSLMNTLQSLRDYIFWSRPSLVRFAYIYNMFDPAVSIFFANTSEYEWRVLDPVPLRNAVGWARIPVTWRK